MKITGAKIGYLHKYKYRFTEEISRETPLHLKQFRSQRLFISF